VQRAVQGLPGVTSLLAVAYLALAITAGVLLSLHRRRPEDLAFARTALLLASALPLVGFLVDPTAPPRLSDFDILDTVRPRGRPQPRPRQLAVQAVRRRAEHACRLRANRRRRSAMSRSHLLVRALGAFYPPFVVLVIVATGNHFLLLAGAEDATFLALVSRI
jgi:hypothetical protein